MTDAYAHAKARSKLLLNGVADACSDLSKTIPLDVTTELAKIGRSLERLEAELFEIAFFGAFSDGKSTLISALTRSLGIPISVEPTTDKVKPYRHGDWLLVDTPGTFSGELLHDEATRSYISDVFISPHCFASG